MSGNDLLLRVKSLRVWGVIAMNFIQTSSLRFIDPLNPAAPNKPGRAHNPINICETDYCDYTHSLTLRRLLDPTWRWQSKIRILLGVGAFAGKHYLAWNTWGTWFAENSYIPVLSWCESVSLYKYTHTHTWPHAKQTRSPSNIPA